MALFLIASKTIVDHIVWDADGRKVTGAACLNRALEGKEKTNYHRSRSAHSDEILFAQFSTIIIIVIIIISSVLALIVTFNSVTQP
jgi:hypothetical protein